MQASRPHKNKGSLPALCSLTLWLGLTGALAQGHPVAAHGCRQGTLEGEVQAGQAFSAPLGNGLALFLQPIASGWIIRVVPETGPQGPYDYAELATPPYRSVTPLSLSTDFAFRAQDAIAWNPRRFRFAPDRASFDRLQAAYQQLPQDPAKAAPAEAMQALAVGASHGIPAQFRILDARLDPGTANQWQAAAAVASHFASTAHTVVQTGPATPLGHLQWMRFRLAIELPANFKPSSGLHVVTGSCE